MGKPLSQAEKNYIQLHGGTMKHVKLSREMLAVFGVSRTPGTISAYLARYNDERAPKNLSILIPQGKPVIKSNRLIQVMTHTDTSLREVARVAGLTLNQTQGLVAKGGIPKPYADKVRAFYKKMGESL